MLSNKKPGTLLHPHTAQILASLGRPFVPSLSSPLVQVQSVPLNYLQLGETGIHDSLDLVPDKQSMCRTLQYNTCITEKQELLAHITSPMPGVRNNSGLGHDCRLPMPMQKHTQTHRAKQTKPPLVPGFPPWHLWRCGRRVFSFASTSRPPGRHYEIKGRHCHCH